MHVVEGDVDDMREDVELFDDADDVFWVLQLMHFDEHDLVRPGMNFPLINQFIYKTMERIRSYLSEGCLLSRGGNKFSFIFDEITHNTCGQETDSKDLINVINSVKEFNSIELKTNVLSYNSMSTSFIIIYDVINFLLSLKDNLKLTLICEKLYCNIQIYSIS